MKLKNLYETDHNPFEDDYDGPYSEADWNKIEIDARERKAAEDKKAVRIEEDGKKVRIVRSLTNGEEVDKITTLEGLIPEGREDQIIQISGVKNIKNLKGLPETCEQLIITSCGLTSLEGIPKHVKYWCSISHNFKLVIDVLPESTGELRIDKTELPSVKLLPKVIVGDLTLQETGIKTFSGIHKHLRFEDSAQGFSTLTLHSKEPVTNLLGLVLVKALTTVSMTWNAKMEQVETWLNDFLEKHRNSSPTMSEIFDLQELLIDENLDEFAQL